jgi:hypothetical protein
LKGEDFMFGLPDVSISLVYLLCLASAIACVVYGAINWNKGGDEEKTAQEDVEWEEQEKKIEKTL